jgi:phosphonate transport system substrate-binding protein
MFKKRIRSTAMLAGVAAVALAAATACGSSSSPTTTTSSSAPAHANWPKTLTIGAVPAENAAATIASLTPLAKLLSDQLGIKVSITTGTSYSALIEDQKAGKVDVVEYGPFSYYIATNVAGVKLTNVGVVINSKGTDGGYYSIGWTQGNNTSINSISDFKGKKICFVDPASTSGYLYPSYGLLSAGINPTKDVTPVFAGAHDASVLAIAKGTCDAGFSEDIMPPQLEKAGKLQASQIKQVWKSPEIPGSPMGALSSLPADLLTQLQTLLVQDGNVDYLAAHGYGTSSDALLTSLGFWGFADPSVANYDAIKQVCAITKSSKCTAA